MVMRDIDAYAVDGGRLKALRVERGLSQSSLAARARVRQQHISAMERKQTQSRPDTIFRLAAALGTVPTALLVAPAGRSAPRPGPEGPTMHEACVARLLERTAEHEVCLRALVEQLDMLAALIERTPPR